LAILSSGTGTLEVVCFVVVGVVVGIGGVTTRGMFDLLEKKAKIIPARGTGTNLFSLAGSIPPHPESRGKLFLEK
jgi:hypothetical protein